MANEVILPAYWCPPPTPGCCRRMFGGLIGKLATRCFVAAGYGLQYGCMAYCALEFVGDFVICIGPSMEPTIFSNDVILTEHISVMRRKLNRGDIVVARSPTNPAQFICKRVVALPGDKIKRGHFTDVSPPLLVSLSPPSPTLVSH
ncbi:IMMP1L [Cordylochernes scorpioides]|uniref:Mitochondrial inner membrane protease subunit n=1 Tax=Cordylochernes scorpioides TaxID=51811 RepID=A0ABY6L5I1_9ARAC|nr:IMMP1L [Cordylochernes scorpioides]